MSQHSQPLATPEGDFIAATEAGTLWELFCERVRRSPDAVAYREYDVLEETWRDHSWHVISDRVDRFRGALAREDVRAGDRIAILLPNGIDWVCLDLAAHGSGLVTVGLYPHETAASNAYILGHSDARLVLLDTEARWRSLWALRSEFPLLKRVWLREPGLDPSVGTSEPAVLKLADVLANAPEPPSPHQAAPSDVATLIYTSGTTGRMKGVMLSHFALSWNAQATATIVPPRRDDVFLSVLPLAHAFERTVGYYLPMSGGSTVAYARSAQKLREDFVTIRPTVMLGVPFLYERMSAAIQASVAGNFARRALLVIAAAVGWRRFEGEQRRANPHLGERLLWPILQRYVVRRVLSAFGGKIRVAASGGASLNRDVARLLIGLGLPLVEGYGLTEAAPVVAMNALDDNLPGSIGRPLRGIDVKLAPGGELLVRSPSLMTGYWKDDAETAHTLDRSGWLSTGDLADIEEGRVFIRGRLREMIVLSIGEKINPVVIEAELSRDPLFEQAIVLGNRQAFLVAIIVLNDSGWKGFAADNKLDPKHPNCREGKTAVLTRVTSLLPAFPRFAQIRAVHLTRKPWTIEAGLLTPTLKIRRDAISTLFAKEIDGLYREH